MRLEHFILNHMNNLRSGIHLDFSRTRETVHHKPTVAPRYTPVLPARGDRKPAVKSPFNYRSTQPSLCGQYTMPCESDVERRAAHRFRTDKNVVEMIEQTPTVKYRAADGEIKKHTFDFWLRLADGREVVVAVKPLRKIVKTGLLDTLARIKRAGVLGDSVHITWVDERFANEDDNANAEWILLARRMRNEEECTAVRALLTGLTTTVRFWDLVRLAPIPAHRRIAIWNLIDDGLLRPMHPGRITYSSLLAICH